MLFRSNIETNLKRILEVKNIRSVTVEAGASKSESTDLKGSPQQSKGEGTTTTTNQTEESGGKDYYIIDKPVGLITVTAPRYMIEKIDAYFTSLQRELYKQISIEAKIIEVQLDDSSAIGINWDSVLKNFSISGAVKFGAETLGNGVSSVGQVWPYVFSNDADGKWDDGVNHGSTYDPTRLVSNIRINTANFNVFLNALKTQGNTKVLSNPKISVLNGQPAMISVGRNVTYVKQVETVVTAGAAGSSGTVTYTAKAGSILSGVGLGLTATILDNNEIIMNLVPVTSELVEGTEQAVNVAGDGATAIKMGLPIVNVREMSTTVRIKDGEMLVIGGLISDMNDETGSFAPVVGDIPLIKYLFGHEEKVKRKRELIILLKPRII